MPVTGVLFTFSHTITLRTLKRTPIYIRETDHFVMLNQHNSRWLIQSEGHLQKFPDLISNSLTFH